MVKSPAPTETGAELSPRRLMVQQPGTGCQKYSSSVRPSSRGRSCCSQCDSSWSTTSSFQSIAMGQIVGAHLRPAAFVPLAMLLRPSRGSAAGNEQYSHHLPVGPSRERALRGPYPGPFPSSCVVEGNSCAFKASACSVGGAYSGKRQVSTRSRRKLTIEITVHL